MGFRRRQGDQLGLCGRKVDRISALGSLRLHDLPGFGQMSETASHAGSPSLATTLSAAAKRLGSSVLPFVVVILIWQFASLFFPRFLFPSLIDVFWRCVEILSDGRMFADV